MSGMKFRRIQEAVVRFTILAAVAAAVTSCMLVAAQTPAWESTARLHRLLKTPISGELIIDSEGVEFRSPQFSRRWPFSGIHTFDLSNRDLTLTIYENRHWHEPGEQRFHFSASEKIPAATATMLASRVGRPARNGAPEPDAAVIATLPAYERGRFGGSNGTLRFRDTGIDFVSRDDRDSHNWRWSDIQTIANPDPYTFRITGYREIAAFELKQPISRKFFDRLWDRLYVRDLNLSTRTGGGQ
jgi:hypothetical protein